MCSRIFRTRDIGRIEREFLDVLDFELGVSEADILSHHAAIMSLLHPQHTCPLQSVISAPKRNTLHHRHVSGDRALSEASTLVLDDIYASEGSSSSSMDVDEPARKVTSFRHQYPSTISRSDAPQPPQGVPLHRAPPRAVSHPPTSGAPLSRKPTPYVHESQQTHAHRLSIPSAFSIFKSLPIFHHPHSSNSVSPTESLSSDGTTSLTSESDELSEEPSMTMSAVAIGF